MVEAGFTTFDVADHYGTAEIIAGTIRRRRPEVRVLTKWVAEPGVGSRDAVRAAVRRSLDRIGVDRLDMLQFHAWRYADPAWLDCMEHLAELREEGLIGQLGVTNFDAPHLDLALRSGFPVVSNQVSYSLFDRRAAGALTAVCRAHDVRLLAYGTLAGGLLSERWVGAPEPAVGDDSLTWSQQKYLRFLRTAGGWERFQALLETADRVGRRSGASLANVAARFVLDQPAVAGIIVGARPGASDHLEDNRRVMDLTLDRDALRELDAAARELDPIPGDCGDEYRRAPYLTASGDLSHHISSFPAPYRTEEEAVLSSGGTPLAVREADRIRLSAQAPLHRGRRIGGDDAAAETHFHLDRIEGALLSLGGSLTDLTTLRVAIRDPEDEKAVLRACAARLPAVSPSLRVEPELDGEFGRVRVEADARPPAQQEGN